MQRSPGVFLGLCVVLEKWAQGMSQLLRTHREDTKWHRVRSPASFPAVDAGTDGRNVRRDNQKERSLEVSSRAPEREGIGLSRDRQGSHGSLEWGWTERKEKSG